MGNPQGPWQDYGDGGDWGADDPGAVPPRPLRWLDDPDAGGGPPRHGRRHGPFRGAVDGVQSWYRNSPLWLQVTTDIAGSLVVLGLVFGVPLALREEGRAEQAGAAGATTTTAPVTVTTTSTTVATTTTAPPPAAPALTSPALGRTTTTTAPPPTTVPPPPSTDAPTTTEPPTTRPEPQYRTCVDAWRAGALPLERGDPGYSPHLDDDGDGRACEWGEGR